MPPLLTSTHENRQSGREQVDIVAVSRHFIETRANLPGWRTARTEGAAIATIVEPLGLPKSLLAAARLYPLVRNGLLTPDDLRPTPLVRLLGTIEDLVQLGRFSLPPAWKPGEALAVSQSEALGKMLLAMVADVRLVVIRIAEQLHCLRHARQATPEEQRAIALETREIYAALANRLGIWQLKWELEDLAFRYLEPASYRRIARGLNAKRAEREASIDEVTQTLGVELAANGIVAELSGRAKHIYSIWRKMQRKDSGLEHIFDVSAVRVLVESVTDCYAALGVVHHRWPYLPGEFDDYIAQPKGNRYQSLHTAVIGPGERPVEVQIRTHDMHRHAEFGVAAHWRYKEGVSARPAFDQKIEILRRLLEPSGQDSELLERIRAGIFEDRVYAISPRGDVVEMPAGSTPLDFAYHVHTEVGHRCRGAKVDGRIVPLTYRVRTGDRIEIITGKEPQPSRDWLSPQSGYLASARSRAKVRNWFRHQDRDPNRRRGRDILEREMSRLNERDIATDEIAQQLKLADTEALHIALGAGDVTSGAVATALQSLSRTAADPFTALKRPARRKEKAGDRMAISGLDQLLYNLARCCRPVPPEAIAGYITQGRGVSIHRHDCGNFTSLRSRHPERVVDVAWGASPEGRYLAELVVHACDREGLLRDIGSVLADEKTGVDSIKSRIDKARMQAVVDVRLSVAGLETLSRTIARLEQLPDVTSVRRRN